MGLPRSEVETRHRWYQRLLVMCLLVLFCFTLPENLRVVSTVGYGLLPLLLVKGLGRPSGQISFHGAGWLFRLLGIATTASGVLWAVTPVGLRSTGVPLLVLWAAFIGWSLLRLLRMLSQESRVSGRVLMGATAGYLLLGLTAGLLFAAIETVEPNSFANAHDASGSVLSPTGTLPPERWEAVWSLDFVRLNYYAFITLTSTGFGDILPNSAQAQMATIVVAILGNFYVAVVMGLLISRLTVQETAEDTPPPPSDGGGPGDQHQRALMRRLEHLVERLEQRDRR
ncbi:potassium channel family protein [Synechococcus sp. FGCU-3]|nr:potassium channel family protein [Synechococcus sp. FGCU3]